MAEYDLEDDAVAIDAQRRRPGIRVRSALGSTGALLLLLLSAALDPLGLAWTQVDEDEPSAYSAYAERPASLTRVVRASLLPVPRRRPEHTRPALPPAPEGSVDLISGAIPPRGTLAAVLLASGIEREQVLTLTESLRPAFDFRKAASGDRFTLALRPDGELVSFQYQHGRSEIYTLQRDDTGALRPARRQVPTERRVVPIAGVVQSSLTSSLLAQGEQSALVDQFTDIFVWQFDFAQESRSGDEYRIVVEKRYDAEGFVRYGKILAAQYRTPERDLTAIYFENGRGRGDYYAPSGRSLRRSVLRAPLRFTRISSGYSKSRLHPVLNRPLPHEAIDYAAPTGTPVWAVAEGRVQRLGWQGGLGRAVVVEHGNGCLTYYGHLSRFGEALKVGDVIEQKRVVGYVGESGLATGPHLDFRVKCGGRWVNPSQLATDPEEGQPVQMEDLLSFEKVTRSRLNELEAAQRPLILEASSSM